MTESAHEPTSIGGPNDRAVGELFRELAGEMGMLVRQEVQLVKVELKDKAVYATKHARLVGVGGALAFLSSGMLFAALILGLSTFMAAWLAALLVGAATGLVALLVAAAGMRALRQMDVAPRQALQSLREHVL